MRRLASAGFKKDFIRAAILPEWWDESCSSDSALLPDLEIRLARFFRIPISTIQDPAASIVPPSYAGAHLRRVRDLDRDRLAPAIHAAIQIASATVRSLRAPRPPVIPPNDGVAWRDFLGIQDRAVQLEDLAGDLWGRGIPVIPVEFLPVPNFQGMACIIQDRPVIVLGQKYDDPGHVAFLIAHETGHIANLDCSPGCLVVDEDYDVLDDADIEQKADRFGVAALAGRNQIPTISASDFRGIAQEAFGFEQSLGVDAGFLIWSWARETRDFKSATMAIKALYRASGARRLLREHFDRHVDLDGANESDRAILRCVFGDPEANEAAD